MHIATLTVAHNNIEVALAIDEGVSERNDINMLELL